METFSSLLAICAGNSPVPGEFPAQRPVTRSFDVFFDLRLNKRLSKQSWGWWFETLWRPLWRHRNDYMFLWSSFTRLSLRLFLIFIEHTELCIWYSYIVNIHRTITFPQCYWSKAEQYVRIKEVNRSRTYLNQSNVNILLDKLHSIDDKNCCVWTKENTSNVVTPRWRWFKSPSLLLCKSTYFIEMHLNFS